MIACKLRRDACRFVITCVQPVTPTQWLHPSFSFSSPSPIAFGLSEHRRLRTFDDTIFDGQSRNLQSLFSHYSIWLDVNTSQNERDFKMAFYLGGTYEEPGFHKDRTVFSVIDLTGGIDKHLLARTSFLVLFLIYVVGFFSIISIRQRLSASIGAVVSEEDHEEQGTKSDQAWSKLALTVRHTSFSNSISPTRKHAN